ALLEKSHGGVQERLERLRDERLLRIRQACDNHLLRRAEWPSDARLLPLRPADWADPVPGWGWQQVESDERGFELMQPREAGDIAVAALYVGPQGRRAVTRAGELRWVP